MARKQVSQEAVIDWEEVNNELKPFVVFGDGSRKLAGWTPQEGSQKAFLQSQAYETLFEGTRGPGKTDALLMDFAQHCGMGCGAEWRGLLFRQTFPQLADVIKKSKKWFRPLFNATYNEGNHTWTWPTGETLQFSYGAREADYWNYHGHSWPWIGFEEITTWADPAFYLKMMSCCRSTVPVGKMPRKFRATTNPYGCVPYGEVLTSRGWKQIRDVHEGDCVLSARPDGALCEAKVARTIEKQWSGTMIHRHGSGLNMVFTIDHRLPRMRGSHHVLTAFNELPGQVNIRRTASVWHGESLKFFSPPAVKMKRQPRSPAPERIDGIDFAELLGWLVSEGSARFSGSQFQIAQEKLENRQRIKSLLERCTFTFSESKNQYQVYSIRWTRWVASLGCSSRFKMIPSWFLRCEETLLRKFFDTAMLGDGCGGVYYTLSRVLADQMTEIAIKLGYSVRTTSGVRDGRKYRGYAVCCSHRSVIQLVTGNTRCKSINVTCEKYSGTVYCLVVPETETFFIRQNGCVWLSGNSGHNWVKARFHLPVLPGHIYGPLIEDRDEKGNKLPERIAIHGYLRENRILLTADPEYESRIRAAARNKAELAAWIDGSWDIIAGGMFDDVWDPARHVVPNFEVPWSWRVDRSFDWGSSRPFSVGWWAESDGSDVEIKGRKYSTVRGDLFRIAEWYGCTKEPNEGLRMLAKDIARGIIERELIMRIHDRCKPGPADAAVFKTENGVCIANDLMQPMLVDGTRRKVAFISSNSGPGTRKAGWELMRQRLMSALPNTRNPGPREFPGLFVSERCEHFRRTVPVLPRDDKDLDDVNSDTEDHIADETRYRIIFSGWRAKGGRVVGVPS